MTSLATSDTGWAIWGADWWDALQALGTLAAVIIALAVPIGSHLKSKREQKRERRNRTASLVSAWVETKVIPTESGGGYERSSIVHLANESDEPVFEVHVIAGFGLPPVRLGPLSMPDLIPVLAARSHREFDVSSGFLGFLPPVRPLGVEAVASVEFRDPRGIRWVRDYDGTLKNTGQRKPSISKNLTEEEGIRQLGDPSNPFNPAVFVLALKDFLDDPDSSSAHIEDFLDPAANWGAIGNREEIFNFLRSETESKSLAAGVHYSAPRVAHMRIFDESQLANRDKSTTYSLVPVIVLTLVFRTDMGWKLWSVGEAQDPTWIPFPDGDSGTPLRGEPEAN